jgi:hypothetical protein
VLKNHRNSTIFLAVLLAVDVILIGLHFLHRLVYRGIFESAILSNTMFSMSEEAKLPDLFYFLKQLAIVLLLLYVARKTSRIFIIWAAIFGYLLIDDVVQIHETIGFAFGNVMPQIGTIAPSEIAQIGFLVLLGLVLFGVSLLIIWRSEGETRQISIYLMALLGLAAFFGVGVDIVQSFVMDIFGVSGVVKVVEDGGEMIIISFILWYVYRLAFETVPKINFDPILLLYKKISHKPLTETSSRPDQPDQPTTMI